MSERRVAGSRFGSDESKSNRSSKHSATPASIRSVRIEGAEFGRIPATPKSGWLGAVSSERSAAGLACPLSWTPTSPAVLAEGSRAHQSTSEWLFI